MIVPFSPPDISEVEIQLVSDALRSGWITTGPRTKQFESEIAAACGVERAICLASATAAMELSLMLLGVGPGDEVITCAYTYTASASVAVHVGAKPILVDCCEGDPAINAERVAAAITPRTKAIIPVDLGGVPADYDAIYAAIADKQEMFQPEGRLQKSLGRIAVIGDAAHSFGATYKGKNVAQCSDFCCFSFHAVKNLTTAEGGAIALHSIGDVSADEMYKQLSLFSLHGQNKDALSKVQKGAWEYDIILPGYKCNMTDIMASLGLAQLERYQEMLRRREEMVARYNRHFDGTNVVARPHAGNGFYGSHHLYITTIDGIHEAARNDLILVLAEAGITANVHYKPLPMMTAYKHLGWDIADFPHAFDYYQKEITLPLHTLLSDEQIDYTANTLLQAARRV